MIVPRTPDPTPGNAEGEVAGVGLGVGEGEAPADGGGVSGGAVPAGGWRVPDTVAPGVTPGPPEAGPLATLVTPHAASRQASVMPGTSRRHH